MPAAAAPSMLARCSRGRGAAQRPPPTSTISRSSSAARAARRRAQRRPFHPGRPQCRPVAAAGLAGRPPPAPPTRPRSPGCGDGSAQGRILIYWGCGEHAAPGQPVEIDLARLARGQVPPAMAALTIRPMTPPSAGHLGHLWRMAEPALAHHDSGQRLAGRRASSRGNYSPEINFALAPGPGLPAADRAHLEHARAAPARCRSPGGRWPTRAAIS